MKNPGKAAKYRLMITAALIVSAIVLIASWTVYAFDSGLFSESENITASPGPTAALIDEIPDFTGLSVIPSYTPGFYNADINLELFAPEGCKVYFTVTLANKRSLTDGRKCQTGETYFFVGGKEPSVFDIAENPAEYSMEIFNSGEGRLKTYLYDKPIELRSYSEKLPLVVTVKARLCRDGYFSGDVQEFSYILGSRYGEKNFSDCYRSMIAVVTTDDENLYSYSKGIFVRGRMYDKSVSEGIPEDPWMPKNYIMRGSEWERPATVTFFDENGSFIMTKKIGIRVAGGTSRNADIRSLKLIAYNDDRSGTDSFDYPFFEGNTDVYGNEITSYKRLVFRNARCDVGGTMVRDMFLNNLGKYANVDYQAGRMCVVYLNGKYYSYMALKESMDCDYQENHYKFNPKDHICSFTIQSNQYQFRYKQEDGTAEQYNSFISDMKYLLMNDFTKKDISVIEEVVDVESFCEYMAYQLYLNNLDWPHNNVLVWKYFGAATESIAGTDGKWRFILKDLDIGFNDPETDSFSSAFRDGLFSGEPCIGPVFANILKNPRVKEIFREKCEYVLSVFTPEFVSSKLKETVDSERFDLEMYFMYNGSSVAAWEMYFDAFYDYAGRRPQYYRSFYERYVR